MSTKKNVLGVLVDAIDYDAAVGQVMEAAVRQMPLSVTALAVHGVMTGVFDPIFRNVLNDLDLVCPDGQPVRWAQNLLHHAALQDRVYGPNLMLAICGRAAAEGLPVFLYGSKAETLKPLVRNLCERFPKLHIAGTTPSRFRLLLETEKAAIAADIRRSGAKVVFCGLGCPRQEIWVREFRGLLPMPLIAVGAAFDFHAGLLAQAPPFLQKVGLEWLFRLCSEPCRLWKRYMLLNPAYIGLFLLQYSGLRRYPPHSVGSAFPVCCPG
jgi:N-acetylglucosaminyldiphosphoundecaprenol N-acetyl-beta-D-mannosaminyltransferase